ncbi:MAG: AAA family ATPase, partial [Pseudomonadota bacterium]|nr:AAA family ATPase [Pseudomonadota bacterium]
MTAQLGSWAQALGGEASGNSIMAPGPGHSPHDRSLSVTLDANAPDGFLVHSFAGDDPIACKDHVRTKLGLPAFQPQYRRHQAPTKKPAQQPKKTYFNYHDAIGAVVYQVERTDYYDGRKKTFRQRRPDGNGGWLWNLGGVRLVPYRLRELIEAAGNGNLIVIAEGERKVDLLRKWNIAATCNSGGRGSVKNWAAHARDYFKPGDKVVLLPDNDKPGQDHANAAGAFLKAVVADVRILDLPGLGPSGDVVDWAAAGGTAEQLHALMDRNARPWAAPHNESVNAQDAPASPAPKAETLLIKASEIEPEPISWVWKHWLARGKLHIIAGAPGGGKTTIYLSFAAIISSGAIWPDGTRAKAGNVLIWTSEDGHADTIIPRLTRMGADLDRIFVVRSQREANGKTRAFNPSTDMESLREKAATISQGVDFVFLDPVVSAVPVTRNSDKNAETRAGLTPFIDFAIELNAAAGRQRRVALEPRRR